MRSARRRRRPALTTVVLGALAVAALVFAVIAVGSPKATTTREQTVTVARGVVQTTVSGSGNLAPAKQADVDFGASGTVSHVYVHAGEHVTEDQLLAELDPSSANVALAQAKAALESAQDTLDDAEEAADSTTRTTTTTASTPSATSGQGTATTGTSTTAAASSATSVASAQAAVDSAQLDVEDAGQQVAATKLRAPIAGTIAEVNGTKGESVSGGGSSSGSSSTGASSSGSGGQSSGGASTSSSTSSDSSAFLTIAQVSRFKMEVSLSESDIGSVKVGQRATVTVNAASGEQFAARVSKIGVLASSSSSSTSSSSAVSYPVTLTLTQTGGKLKAGMSATADIVTAQASGIVVPSQALTGSTVTVVSGDKRTTRTVQTGLEGDSTTQVVSGLKAGEQVVVRSVTASAGTSTATSRATGSSGGGRLGVTGRFGGGGFGGGGFGAGSGPGGPPTP